MEMKCLHCKKVIDPVKVNYKRRKYCNRKCYRAFVGKDLKSRPCPTCGNTFRKKSRDKFCSTECWYSYPNKKFKGRGHINWKGDDVSYKTLHRWVRDWRGKASSCVVCDAKEAEWANLSGEYKRDLYDFISLCRSCHRAWDFGNLSINLFEWQERMVN